MFFVATGGSAWGQRAWVGGQRWNFRRTVVLEKPPSRDGEVCVLDFWAHGAITDEKPDVRVHAGSDRLPVRILQRGPGDFIRLAFQARGRRGRYEVYYGGKSDQPPPTWTAQDGLLFEVHRFDRCDFTRLESVRSVFERTETIGADYVGTPYLSNPLFTSNTTPLLCRFQGKLHIRQPGRYKFALSSHDASWLLIDGKQVLAWPGRHGPLRRARHAAEVNFVQGDHSFEVYNASDGGGGFTVVVVWQPPGANKFSQIPPEAFGQVHRAKTERLESRRGGTMPDVRAQNFAEAPLGDGRPPLIRVRFRAGFTSGKLDWDFGDGQTSTQVFPQHVYLSPGLYTVKCSRPGSKLVAINRILVEPPWRRLGAKDASADIEKWMPEIREYDPTTMPADVLRQLVAVYEALEEHEEAARVGLAGLMNRKADAVALKPERVGFLVQDLVFVLTERLNRLADALRACDHALKLQPPAEAAARLWLASARVALKLDRVEDCQKRLEQAERVVGGQPAELQRELYELRGDLARRAGIREAAIKFYGEALKRSASQQWDIRRRTAMTGAYSRGVEDALRSHRLDEAGQTLRQWVSEMPTCKLDGYYALLKARYELARRRPKQAILEAEDLLRIAPDNPYADRLLLVQADSYALLGDEKAWKDTLERLRKDYPGSPFVPDVRQALAAGFEEAKAKVEAAVAAAESRSAELEDTKQKEAATQPPEKKKRTGQRTPRTTRRGRARVPAKKSARPARPGRGGPVRRPNRAGGKR